MTEIEIDDNAIINTALNNLREMKKKEPERRKTLRDKIVPLEEEIRDLLNMGHSYEAITQVLNDSGIELSSSTLRHYVLMEENANGKEKSKNQNKKKALKNKSTQKPNSQPSEPKMEMKPKEPLKNPVPSVSEEDNSVIDQPL